MGHVQSPDRTLLHFKLNCVQPRNAITQLTNHAGKASINASDPPHLRRP